MKREPTCSESLEGTTVVGLVSYVLLLVFFAQSLANKR